MSDPAFIRLLAFFEGNQSALAKAIGTSQQRVSYIASRGNQLPAELVLAAERVSGIPRHDFRPDLYPAEVTNVLQPDAVALCPRCNERADDVTLRSCCSRHCPLRAQEAA